MDAATVQSVEEQEDKLIKESKKILEEEYNKESVAFFANTLDKKFFGLLQEFITFNKPNKHEFFKNLPKEETKGILDYAKDMIKKLNRINQEVQNFLIFGKAY